MNKLKKLIISLPALVASPLTVLAAAVPTTAPTDPFGGRFGTIANIISVAMNLLIGIGIGLIVIFLVIGGIQWTTAGGDKMAAENARKTITNAIIGFVVVIGAVAIRFLITTLLGATGVPTVPTF